MDILFNKANIKKAIGHSLWEAHACVGPWAFCAGLAMLRKAIDLWSGIYRDKYGMRFLIKNKEKDNLYWRLHKIAEKNNLYKDSIHTIIDKLRIKANENIHEPYVCSGGRAGTYYGDEITQRKNTFLSLHKVVVDLIASTMPDVEIIYSDKNEWKKSPT